MALCKTAFIKIYQIDRSMVTAWSNQRNSHSALRPHCSTLNPRSTALNPHCSTLNPRSSALNPRSSTRNPHCSTLNPWSSALNHAALLLNLTHFCLLLPCLTLPLLPCLHFTLSLNVSYTILHLTPSHTLISSALYSAGSALARSCTYYPPTHSLRFISSYPT